MEFDEPLVLLEKRDSVLRSLADEMGAEGASRLVGLARAARNERIPPPKMATP